jgi:tryptophan 2,3-dioxygenase
LEAGFRLAKSLAASNQNDKAAEVLKSVIRQDEIYSTRTLLDPDLATKPEILQMNEELRLEEKNNSLALLDKSSQLKEKAINEWKIMESKLSGDFNELCQNIPTAIGFMSRDNYLSYLKAKKHFNQFISDLL